jgi:hypothetical protein
MDGKAQGTITIAGVFLAAVFATVRAVAEGVATLDKVLIALAVLLLGISVVFAGLALRVRAIPAGPPGDEVQRAIEDIVDARADEQDECRIQFLRSQIIAWAECARTLVHANAAKARHVKWAQGLLFVGIACALVVALRDLLTG